MPLLPTMFPHFLAIQGHTKNTPLCISTIATLRVAADMLTWDVLRFIKAASIVDAGVVNMEQNQLWERLIIHNVNFDRYLRMQSRVGM